MKICALSDTHGYLPDIPDCDLLLLAGDYTAVPKGNITLEYIWFEIQFKQWLNRLTDRGITVKGCFGNHDFIGYHGKHLIPKDLKWEWYEDTNCIFNGYKIHFSPWQPPFFNWAFNAPESKLKEYWKLIPDDVDILVTHCPPYNILDCLEDGKPLGSYTLSNRILKLNNLKCHIFGHIHFSYGIYEHYNIKFINAAHCNEEYQPVNPPIVVEL